MLSEIRIEKFRSKLLHKAFLIYEEAKGAIERLPTKAQVPIKVAVESYMGIERVLGESGYKTNSGRATMPIMRRISVV
jgi:15-cis-phytoene synthase / lycopene beta-cyclase